MSKFSAADVLELPVQERLQLVEDIWNTIADAPEALEVSNEDKRFIDERLEARHLDPNAGAPWEEVYARITSPQELNYALIVRPEAESDIADVP